MIMTILAVFRYRIFIIRVHSISVFSYENLLNFNLQVCNLEQQKCAKVVPIPLKNRAVSIAVEPKEGYVLIKKLIPLWRLTFKNDLIRF